MTPPQTMSLKIFIVEDHLVMREMLSAFLAANADYEVRGMADSAEEALGYLGERECDLVLVDVSLPGMSGIELVATIEVRWPELPCMMLSGHGERSYVQQALAAGARGYVLKGDPYELPSAINAVMRGETYLSEVLHTA